MKSIRAGSEITVVTLEVGPRRSGDGQRREQVLLLRLGRAAQHDVGGDAEDAREVLRALHEARHPVDAVSDAGEHQRSPTGESISGPDASCEHPGVLRAAALRGIHDERAFGQRDAREPARDELHLAPGEHERTQIEVARRDPVLDERRARRERERGLRDVVRRGSRGCDRGKRRSARVLAAGPISMP